MVVLISISVSVDDRRALFASGEDMYGALLEFESSLLLVACWLEDPKIHFSDGTPS